MLKLLDPRNSLFFKIFLWFWLTILVALILVFLFANFSDNYVESHPLTGPRLINLERLGKGLADKARYKKPDKSLEELASHPRISRHRLLFLVNTTSGESFFNKDNIHHIDTSQLAFSHQMTPQAIVSADFRAAGPVKLTHQKHEYLLYEIEPWRNPPFGIRIMLMPHWLKLIIILAVSVLLSLIFSRMLINPINRLKHASSQLAKGNLSARIDVGSKRGDELVMLANDFNKMAHRLEVLVTSQKRLMADVSHELRSPLTRLQMATGLAQMKQTDEQKGYFERIEKEANNLENMISDVLKLSRLEARNHYSEKEILPIDSVLNPVLKDAIFEAEQQGKRIHVNGSCERLLNVDPALLSSAFENILRNAIKYAKQDIEVTLADTHNMIKVTITDDGEGVDEQELPLLLAPFYRVSHSRQRNNGGAGLGLAIAKQAINHHDGEITLANHPEKGLEVTIVLHHDNIKTT